MTLGRIVIHWLDVFAVVYVVGLLVGAGCGIVLLNGGLGEIRTVWFAKALSAASFFGGAVIAIAAVPDWSPLTTVYLFAPFWALCVWSILYARRLGRGAPRLTAARSAAFVTLPLLLLTPVAAIVAWAVWIPGLLVTALVVAIKWPRSESEPRTTGEPS